MRARVRDYMTSEVETLAPENTLMEALRLEMQLRIRHIPVVDKGELVGILTDRDLKRATPSVLSDGDRADQNRVMTQTKVGQIMTRSPQVIEPDAPLYDAVETMANKKYGALPVVDGGKLAGIITETDLLRAFLSVLEK